MRSNEDVNLEDVTNPVEKAFGSILEKFPEPEGSQQWQHWSAAAPGFEFQQFYRSSNPVSAVLEGGKLPTPEESLCNKFQLIVWWPEAEHVSLRGTVCCVRCKQSKHVTHDSWMARPHR